MLFKLDIKKTDIKLLKKTLLSESLLYISNILNNFKQDNISKVNYTDL